MQYHEDLYEQSLGRVNVTHYASSLHKILSSETSTFASKSSIYGNL
jgi:hypothetical protein